MGDVASNASDQRQTNMSRPSLEFQREQERLLATSNHLKSQLEQTNAKLRLVQNPIEFNNLDSEESGVDFEDSENRDPAIISTNLVAQTVRIVCTNSYNNADLPR